MRVTSLQDSPQYEALSYVWGNTANKRPILVNCKTIFVTINLEEALRYLRRSDQTATIWVDAVCINQDDQREKAIQVNMMSTIYSKSTHGVVWLGDYHEYGLVAEQVREGFELVRKVTSQKGDIETGGVMINVEDIKPAATKALEAFMKNPWWLRIWTVQEVIFPPEVIVQWGDQSIMWETLESVTTMLAHIHRTVDIDRNLPAIFRGHRLTGPVSAILLYRHKIDPSPLNLFWRFRYRYATMPEDKIFGLLSFLGEDEKEQLQLKADYSMSPAAVYTSVSLSLIKTTRNLKPLIGRRGESQITENLPSWVVDWGRPQPTEPGVHYTSRYFDHAHRYGWFSAHNETALFLDFNAVDSTISLRGHLVDSIRIIGSHAMQKETHVDLSAATINEFIDNWEHLLSVTNGVDRPYPSGTTMTDAFWRTLTGNMMTRNGEPVRWLGTEDRSAFEKFRQTKHKVTCSCEILDTLKCMFVNQGIFVTQKGYVGLGPPNIQQNDELWLIFGCNVPLLLRPVSKKNGKIEAKPFHYVLVGDCYVHGLMLGEYIRGLCTSDKGEIVTIH
jgi:hypothetical protein